MTEPKIAVLGPAILELEPGIYWWCRCGESNRQPFCDGTHKLKGLFKPLMLELKEKSPVELCQCKRTGDAPFCDNTHKTLPGWKE